ncbi:hypothetical protein BDN70DRAFT_939549 [Pholiota conissans]|uniref:Uncharacterized protein n=1 Tax=Pholiota conissans TaxID=109636 RepID=A0A9P5YKJ7_9AGAR|nr:hypothetical protein BDN70DRAFT_939549 [Pholiota conissans]
MATEKRKVSDLFADITSWQEKLLSIREQYAHLGMDEDNEDLGELNRIIDKLTDATHTPLSFVSARTFETLGIEVRPMKWRSGGEKEAVKMGSATALMGEDARKEINLIFKYVSLESNGGCNFLTSALVRNVAFNLSTDAASAAVVPYGRGQDILPEGTENPLRIVDYMLFYSDKDMRDKIVRSKFATFIDNDPEVFKFLKCNIYGANPKDLYAPRQYLPQAAIAAILRAQRLELKTFRGCVTSGKQWAFFVYTAEDSGRETVYWLKPIPLGTLEDPTANLELVLGVLRDWSSKVQPSRHGSHDAPEPSHYSRHPSGAIDRPNAGLGDFDASRTNIHDPNIDRTIVDGYEHNVWYEQRYKYKDWDVDGDIYEFGGYDDDDDEYCGIS